MKRASRLKAAFIICLASMVSVQSHAQEESRPSFWAEHLQVSGVPNLHRVNESLYRSAQPDEEGMINLKKIGIKTIVNLRASHSDQDEIGETRLVCEHIPMNTWDIDEDDVIRFLAVVTNPENMPVLVHCKHGADRTGTMVAVYRIAVQGWPKKEAIEEMTRGGFGFHEIWKNLPVWIESLDIDRIRKEAGIQAVQSSDQESAQ